MIKTLKKSKSNKIPFQKTNIKKTIYLREPGTYDKAIKNYKSIKCIEFQQTNIKTIINIIMSRIHVKWLSIYCEVPTIQLNVAKE